MDYSNLRLWLSSDSAPGWIACAITVIGAAIGWYLKRSRPRHIFVTEEFTYPLAQLATPIEFDGPSTEKSKASGIATTLDGASVREPHQVYARLTNSGSEPIVDGLVVLRFSESTVVRKVSTWMSQSTTKNEFDGNWIRVRVPFLNPWREHGNSLSVAAIVEGSPDISSVDGSGIGWSSILDRQTGRRRLVDFGRTLLLRSGLVFFTLSWAPVAQKAMPTLGGWPAIWALVLLPLLWVPFEAFAVGDAADRLARLARTTRDRISILLMMAFALFGSTLALVVGSSLPALPTCR